MPDPPQILNNLLFKLGITTEVTCKNRVYDSAFFTCISFHYFYYFHMNPCGYQRAGSLKQLTQRERYGQLIFKQIKIGRSIQVLYDR